MIKHGVVKGEIEETDEALEKLAKEESPLDRKLEPRKKRPKQGEQKPTM